MSKVGRAIEVLQETLTFLQNELDSSARVKTSIIEAIDILTAVPGGIPNKELTPVELRVAINRDLRRIMGDLGSLDPHSRNIYLEAEDSGQADTDFLEWWLKHPSDYELLAEQHPNWYLWGVAYCMSWEANLKRLDECVKRDGCAGLIYVPHFLFIDDLDKLSFEYPQEAVRYAFDILAERLPDRLRWCVKMCPRTALSYHSERLTPEWLKWCTDRVDMSNKQINIR